VSESRFALLIATGRYDHPGLQQLRSPVRDAEGLTEVLQDHRIGGFEVRTVVDGRQHEVNRAIEDFFLDRGRDDLLLLHISCHGIKNDDGELYFAARDTDRRLLGSTGVSAAFLHTQMRRCRAKSIVLLLDCCYSGAFLPGSKGDTAVHVKEELAGHGRAVLTATNRAEYAWEGNQLSELEPEPSRFTGAVIEGLRSGEADGNRDGLVSVHDLYDYVYERLRADGVKQRPQMWSELEYRVVIARSLLGDRRAEREEREAPPAGQQTQVSSPKAQSERRTWPQGQRLGGRYELGMVIGRGGLAEVYLGHDTRLGRTVAVKTLRADFARDPSFQARFRREAQTAASLNHPAIVAVYDTSEEDIDGTSIPYIVMQYVDGSTLHQLLRSGRKLLPERDMEITIGILQALEYSHRNGIVHRDIKPTNVMLTRNGEVKVMDFGVARALGDADMTMTQTAAIIGTAHYMSPELAKGEQVDARSDLYSTGCLLYELFTLRPPFIGDSPVAVAYQHVREEPVPPSAVDREITPEMDAIVLKVLAKDPDHRYQSAAEMRADIEACLDGHPVGAPFSAYWFAVPERRPLMSETDGRRITELEPGKWYLAFDRQGLALVVQTQDGLRGLLTDTSGLMRG